MFEHGAQIVKFDLHVHTKSEKTSYTDRKYSNEEYAVRFVQTMQEKDIKIVATTNHNLFNKEEYLAISKEAVHSKEKAYSESLLEPAFIEASDARSINDIGKEYSEIKMGELSFDALSFALSLHRLRMNNKESKQYSWIKGIQFSSNKCLNNVNVPLNKNLNTLIGVRGSGKSTIIESIRYAFELDAKEDANYKEDLLEELLGSGNEIIVDLVDKRGNVPCTV